VPRNVIVDAGQLRHAQNIAVGPHVLQADELVDVGGNDAGPNPFVSGPTKSWATKAHDIVTLPK